MQYYQDLIKKRRYNKQANPFLKIVCKLVRVVTSEIFTLLTPDWQIIKINILIVNQNKKINSDSLINQTKLH